MVAPISGALEDQMFDAQLAQADREIERRLHHDDFVKRKPEYLDLERVRQWEAMRATLNSAEQTALNVAHDKAEPRRFTGERVTAMGALA